MKIKVIGSGSSGNCYRIDDGKTALLLECGLPIKKIKEGCDFNLSSIAGCLVTHEHGDHAKGARELMAAGVDMYMTEGTAKALALTGHRLTTWDDRWTDKRGNPLYFAKQSGSFSFMPFSVHHDATAPVGFVVQSEATQERLLFMTDTYYTEYTFQGLTHVMLEANFSQETLPDDARRHRLMRSHMSIENCIEMLQANDLSAVREIWLLHLSSGNGDAEVFKRKVQEATGKPVFVA